MQKNKQYLLCIDTALSTCSVAIGYNNSIIGYAENNQPNSASECINQLVDDALIVAKIKLSNINAIAITNGPGSYTGLRIAASIAKAYAYTLSIPIYTFSTLAVMAFHALQQEHHYDYIIPTIDARRDELFMGIYDKYLNSIVHDQAIIISDNLIDYFDSTATYLLTGNANHKITLLTTNNKIRTSSTTNYQYTASDIYKLYLQEHIDKETDIAYFEPFYTKQVYIAKKNNT